MKISNGIYPKKWTVFFVYILFLFTNLALPSWYGSAFELYEISKESALISYEIDCDKTNDIIHSYGEINCGPLPNWDRENAVDLTEQYNLINIDFIRTHDFYGPTDISQIFPDLSADPTIPSNYNFTLSDVYISGIVSCGAKVFYRLGESASDQERLRRPPENFSTWSQVCKHIVMHYNDGWADGYHYNITYWEIWNEPDLSGFWNGTAQQYYELYQMTAETLKSYDPLLRVGGPCTSSVDDPDFTTGFLSYVHDHQVPLDFFSWHMYASRPGDLYVGSQKIRSLLDDYGFTDVENINTEWNYDILSPQRDKDNARNAAFTACAITAFHDAGLDHAFRYRGTQDNNPIVRLIGFDLSLFSEDGTWKTPALSYLAFAYMQRFTALRLETPVMDAQDQITMIAGISPDQDAVSIIISNFNKEDQDCILDISHLPWESSYRIVQYHIDDEHHFQIVEENKQSTENIQISTTVNGSTVQWFWLTNTDMMPVEGPRTLDIPWWLQLRFLDPFFQVLGFLILFLVFS